MSLTCCFGEPDPRESASYGPPSPPPAAPSRSTLNWFRKLYGYSRRRTYRSDSTSSSFAGGRRRFRRNHSATTGATRRTSGSFSGSDPTIPQYRRPSSNTSWYRRFTRKRYYSSGRPKEPPAVPPKRKKAGALDADGERRPSDIISGSKYFQIKRFWERLTDVSPGHWSKSKTRGRSKLRDRDIGDRPPRLRRKMKDNRGMSVPTLESTEF